MGRVVEVMENIWANIECQYIVRRHAAAAKQKLTHKTLPKAQRTRGLSSYHRILIKHQLQNLKQTSASRLNLRLES